MEAAGEDTSLLDDEAALDQCTLRIPVCLMTRLLLTELKLPILAERFNAILEERMNKETSGGTIPGDTNAALTKSHVTVERSKRLESQDSPSLNLLAPHTKKRSLEEPNKYVNVETENAKARKLERARKFQREFDAMKVNVEKDKADEVEDKNGEANKVTAKGPSNPFAKPSNNQQNTSLKKK